MKFQFHISQRRRTPRPESESFETVGRPSMRSTGCLCTAARRAAGATTIKQFLIYKRDSNSEEKSTLAPPLIYEQKFNPKNLC